MRHTIGVGAAAGLEDLCKREGRERRALICPGSGAPGIERAEARFNGPAFAPHRHDTYALGITLAGIQTFRYRGEQRYCLPGEAHILHPDELHDGAAAGEDGFAYRIVYIDPALVQQALGGQPLPFVADPVVRDRGLVTDLRACLEDIDSPIGEFEAVEISSAVGDMLSRLAQTAPVAVTRLEMPPLLRAREAIADDPASRISARELEQVTGLDRWSLARQFRAAFGTSPTRFRTMRQLDVARALMREGRALADVALEAGFADQSHLSRLFKRAYGLTPCQWISAQRA